jgi:3-dehydroquinate synthase
MEKIRVPLGDRSYSILIAGNSLSDIGRQLGELNFPRRLAVISNEKISRLYGNQVKSALESTGCSILEINLPDGEEFKTLKTLELIYDALIEANFDRGTGLIALGGGVIGDVVGFAAATFLRGVPFVQIPTTLLAQVDSSVGGKTAVNHPLGKNLIGAFYQPSLVLIDVETLKTLESREIAAGFAEVVKYGVIRDYEFFCWLEKNVSELTNLNKKALISAIKRSCQIKSDIVEVDEREGSIRAFLNYGHTFGHAIEALAGYGEWKHGEAIAVGMVVAANISQRQGLCSQNDVQRITNLLQAFKLPTEPPDFPLKEYLAAMQRDKKVKQGTLSLVLNQGIGEVVLQKVSDISTVFSEILPN